MHFLYTKFIYPLESKLLLSKKLGLYIDNPRGEEIPEFLDILKKNVDYEEIIPGLVVQNKITNEIAGLDEFVSWIISDYPKNDKYAQKAIKDFGKNSCYGFLAAYWVLIRYSNEVIVEEQREIDKHRDKYKNDRLRYVFASKDAEDVIRERICCYCHLLSLLVYPNGDKLCHGENFLLNDCKNLSFIKLEGLKLFQNRIFSLSFGSKKEMLNKGIRKEFNFHDLRDDILYFASQFDEAIEDNRNDQLFYIATILRSIGSGLNDFRAKFVLLVSIIELLVTHQPDNQRFNVEDSINKQFQLKGSVAIYKNNGKYNINELKDRLKFIYKIRSFIAHGDFKSLEKLLKRQKNFMDIQWSLEELSDELYVYIKAIVSEYLKDKKYINFLKNS